MIDSVIYTPSAVRPASVGQGSNLPSTPSPSLATSESASVDAPISQRGPHSRLDSYREISQFVDAPRDGELLSGIDIRV